VVLSGQNFGTLQTSSLKQLSDFDAGSLDETKIFSSFACGLFL
jgi:hypothetical protein